MIRLMEPGDAEAYAALASQLGYPCHVDEVLRRWNPEIPRTTPIFVAVSNDRRVVGWVGCRIDSGLYHPDYGEITGLVVDQNFRSQSWGAQLLARAEQWFSDQGVDLVRVKSNSLRTRAHQFYEREGYLCQKSQQVFTKTLASQGTNGAKP